MGPFLSSSRYPGAEGMKTTLFVKERINEVEKCAKEIVDLVQNEENEKDDEDNYEDECTTLTRSSSHIDEIFDLYNENNEDSCNDNEENVLYQLKDNDVKIYENESRSRMQSFLGKKRTCNRKGC